MRMYRVRDWDNLYENNRTRDMKKMSWVPIPIKLSGDGYTSLMEAKNGAALFGAWIAVVEVAATCDPRGTLIRKNGIPHDAASLARITRMKVQDIKEMLDFCSCDLMWFEIIDMQEGAEIPQEGAEIPQEGAEIPQEGAEIPQEGAEIPQEGAEIPQETVALGNSREGKGILGNSREENTTRARVDIEGETLFDAFWAAYPRKVGKGAARRAWQKIPKPTETLAAITKALDWQKKSDQWTKESGQFIPHPSTYLNQARWEDEQPSVFTAENLNRITVD